MTEHYLEGAMRDAGALVMRNEAGVGLALAAIPGALLSAPILLSKLGASEASKVRVASGEEVPAVRVRIAEEEPLPTTDADLEEAPARALAARS